MAVKEQVLTGNYAIYNGDCVEVMKELPDNSVHFSIYSPPFRGLYHYSSDPRDLSNCCNQNEFFAHYNHCLSEKTRVTMPGRLSAVHCSDMTSGNSGNDHLQDFPGDLIRIHEKHGWKYVARHTIWKEPLWMRNKTMAKNLAHRTIVQDAARAGVAYADYLIVFRKRGENPIPIQHPTGFDRYAGAENMPNELLRYKNWDGDQKQNRFSHWIWRRYASSVWDDIRINRILKFKDCKEDDDEEHVHPLYLDVIERAILLRTNPGEIVLTPFMGVGSEVYCAVLNGRRGIGAELKPSYFRQAVKNLENIQPMGDDQCLPLNFSDEGEI